jgi:uncharacterized RDD family membrane protein YckC
MQAPLPGAPRPLVPARGIAPGLARRLAACLYDGLVLVAVEMLAGAAWVALSHAAVEPGDWRFRSYLLAVAALFFAGFWTRGETLGMRAWRLRILGPAGGPPDLGRALLRFFAALLSWFALGLGFLWVLVDREHLAWHDRLSGTRLVLRDSLDGGLAPGRGARNSPG